MNFDSLFDFQAYCQFKDLEGVYCDSCRRWLVYGEESVDKSFYIVSDKLIACPECVKVRNGHYPYLSDFSMFRKAFLKCKDKKKKQEILSFFRSTGEERFLKKDILIAKYAGCETERLLSRYGDMFVFRNKFKCIPIAVLNHNYKNEIVGHTIYFNPYEYISHLLIEALRRITSIQHHRPLMKYVVIRAFGTLIEKMKLYNYYKQSDSVLIGLDYETFYDDFGLCYIKAIEDSAFNDPILDLVKKENMTMMLHIYDQTLHWSERLQHYYKRWFYKPKRFNVHKLGYY